MEGLYGEGVIWKRGLVWRGSKLRGVGGGYIESGESTEFGRYKVINGRQRNKIMKYLNEILYEIMLEIKSYD